MRSRALPLLALAPLLLAACLISVGQHGVHAAYSGYGVRIGLWSALVLAADLWAWYHVWTGPRSTGAKLVWTLLIFFFPFGGVVLFFLFGHR